ncbi:MAG: DUF951 domain-containing protein [Chloroflexi bacterium]|nr:DUF951 domain-containing protein [Chloroflexota bacterium]
MQKVEQDIRLGDIVRLRKKHPCGSTDWEVVRLGADIGLVCQGCGRRVLLPRSRFQKRLLSILSPARAEASPAKSPSFSR